MTRAGSGAGASDKTCDDLKACCDMLEGMNMMVCTQAYDAIKSSGDAACGQIYSSLGPLGCK